METKVAVVVFSSIVLTLGCFISYFKYHVGDGKLKPEVNLAVCILSARDNFGLRDAIRNTWLSDVNRPDGLEDSSLLAKFIIGSKACPIHPNHRISPYSCEAWNPKLPANPSDELASFAASPSSKDARACALTSVSFLIMHDIILKRVGILELFPFAVTDDVQVALYDTISMEEIGRTRFISSQQGSIFQGFKYRPVEEMILPKEPQEIVRNGP